MIGETLITLYYAVLSARVVLKYVHYQEIDLKMGSLVNLAYKRTIYDWRFHPPAETIQYLLFCQKLNFNIYSLNVLLSSKPFGLRCAKVI